VEQKVALIALNVCQIVLYLVPTWDETNCASDIHTTSVSCISAYSATYTRFPTCTGISQPYISAYFVCMSTSMYCRCVFRYVECHFALKYYVAQVVCTFKEEMNRVTIKF